MSTVSLAFTVDVNAPAEVVWDHLVAWESQGAWMLGTSVRVADGAPRAGVGARIEAFTGLIPSRGIAGFLDTMTITLWEPPKRCEVLHTGRVVKGTGAFEVESLSASTSRFHWSEEIALPFGVLGRIGWFFVGPAMGWGVRHSLARFAAYASR